MCSPIALRRSMAASVAKREHEINMQFNNIFNILKHTNFHIFSTPSCW